MGAYMQIGISAYLRNLAVRCNQIARQTGDQKVKKDLERITTELADKAQIIEDAFRVPGR
jgi:hypothetical protein